MVLIPNDIGIRMRLQAEAQLLQPVAPLTEILGDLPDIQPGQQFTARILEALPQGTYKAAASAALLSGGPSMIGLPALSAAGAAVCPSSGSSVPMKFASFAIWV